MAPSHGGAGRRLLLTGLFFASGAVGLAYEVAWTRGLLRLLGSTAVGSALVLAAFVGGLGLGARWIGRRVEGSRRPLAVYGALEVAAALWALAVLPLSHALEAPYVALATGMPDALRWILRAVVATGLVMPGAMLLGGTLPAVERAWTGGEPGEGRALAWLYGINTLGAVVGALLTGFWLLEALGVAGALRWGAALGALAGSVALLAARGRPARAGTVASGSGGRVPPAALAAAFLAGFLGLGLELAGFRLLTFFVEGFTPCLTAMLATWIAGLGLGSLAAARRRAPRDPQAAVGRGLLLAGASALLTVVLLLAYGEAWLPGIHRWAYAGLAVESDVAAGQRWFALAGAALLLLLPALAVGTLFPHCVRWARAEGAAPSAALGRVYVWSSLGTLAAPPLLTLVFVPWRGPLAGWCALVGLAFAGSVALARRAWGGRRAALRWIVPAGLAALVVAVSPGDARLVEASHVLAGTAGRRLLAVGSDSVTTASVIETDERERILFTDDFAAAATGRHYKYMRLLGHLPALLAKEPANALVICFGTGTTAGAVAAHPGVRRLEVAEVSRAVLDLAPWFGEANRGVLEDPRTRLLVDDGRDALLLHAPDLDLLTLEPLMPYSPAGLPFYTREFYELARDRLRDGGVLCQWVPVHAMPAGLYAALLRTFFEVFPEGTLWFCEQSSVLLARKGTAAPDRATLETRFAAVRADLEAAGYPTLDVLASALLADGHAVLAAPAPDPRLAGRRVTDLDPWPEFHATPRGVRTSYLVDTLVYLSTLTDGVRSVVRPLGTDETTGARAHDGAALGLQARVADAAADVSGSGLERLAHLEDAARLYGAALERAPGEAALTWRRARAARRAAALRVADLHAKARAARAAGRGAEAADLEGAATAYALAAFATVDGDARAGGRGGAARTYALALLRQGRCRAALRALDPSAAADGGEEPEHARWLSAVAALVEGRGAAPPLPSDLPACRGEGLEAPPVRAALASWRDALARGAGERSLRVAALHLLRAVGDEDCAAEVLGVVRAETPGEDPRRVAHLALVRSRLKEQPDPLLALLASNAWPTVASALEQAAALRAMKGVPGAVLETLARAPEPSVREALATALGSDPVPAARRLLIDLLADGERAVRAAAVAALVPGDPRDMSDYDPDGPPESWARVQRRLRR